MARRKKGEFVYKGTECVKKPERIPPISRERIFTEKEITQIEALAGMGLTQAEVCRIIGVSPTTFIKHQKKNEILNEAVERGRAKTHAVVARELLNRCKDGDVPAIRWFEMTRHGMGEKMQTEQKVDMNVSTDSITDDEWNILAELRHEIRKDGKG